MWAIFVLSTFFCCVRLDASLLGGKTALKIDEFNSDHFGQILERANLDCNRLDSHLYWHKHEAVIDATKQIVEGVLYEFKLRQRPTNCRETDVLLKDVKQHGSVCTITPDSPIKLCSVRVWHRPWKEPPMEVTVNDYWLFTTDDGIYRQIYQISGKDGSASVSWDEEEIEELVDRFNLESNTAFVYKFVNTEVIQPEPPSSDGQSHIIVYLEETKCRKPGEIEAFSSVKESECFNQLTGNSFRCRLIQNEGGKQMTRLGECQSSDMKPSSMWRLYLAEQSNASDVCQPEVANETVNVENIQIFARSDVLSVDNPDWEPVLQQYINQSVWEYNRRSNCAYMYKMHVVKEVKHEVILIRISYKPQQLSPPGILTFKLLLQETDCRKNKGYLENMDKFLKECQKINMSKAIEQCKVSVKPTKLGEFQQLQFTIGECKRLPSQFPIMLGSVKPMNLEERKDPLFQSVVNQTVEQYNAQSNSLYLFDFEKLLEATVQTVSGKRYLMNITLKATGCKRGSAETCLSPSNTTFMHCQVSVLRKLWMASTTINFTKCWESVLLLQPVVGVWEEIATEKLSDQTLERVLENSLMAYKKLYDNQSDYTLDYVTDARRLKMDTRELDTFLLHLKGKSTKENRLKCHVKVLRENDANNGEMYFVHNCLRKERRERLNPGSPRLMSEEEMNSHKFQTLTVKANKRFNSMSNDTYFYRAVRVTNASTQIVSGILTQFDIHLKKTVCSKEENEDIHGGFQSLKCGLSHSNLTTLCKVKFWEQPWKGEETLEVMDCNVKQPNINSIEVHSLTEVLQSKAYFSEMLFRVVSVFNLKTGHSVLYQAHHVEELVQTVNTVYFDLTHYGLQSAHPGEYKFKLILRPTKCKKWSDAVHFYQNNLVKCQASIRHHVVTCGVKVTREDNLQTREHVELSGCRYLYIGSWLNRRALTNKELMDVKFQEIVDRAVKTFNLKTTSTHWYKLFVVEDAAVEQFSGKLITFELLLMPSSCRVEKINMSNETNSTECGEMQNKMLISCQVRYWNRAWIENQETIDVKDCAIITQPSKTRETGSSDWLVQKANRERCAESLLPRLIHIFNNRTNSIYIYDQRPKIHEIQEHPVPGTRLTFDLYLEPNLDHANCSVNNETESGCPLDKHFYTCKATYWARPWMDDELLELTQCMMIEANLLKFYSQPFTGAKLALKEMKDQAIELYNTKLANGYVFGSTNITNVSHEFAGGLKTTFILNMRPIACKLEREKKGCDLSKTVVRAHCFVTVWYRPWMQQTRQLFLTKCREYFDGGSSTKPQPLSNEERNTPEFKSMLDTMLTMYKPDVPLTYEVEKILNAKVKVDNQWRNITFNLFLKPNGCNQTLPNADDPRCVNWEKQDTVRCEAEVCDLAGDNGGKRLYLRNCQILWKRESKRPLNSDELLTTWFKESVQSAWKLQQSVRQQSNFYTVVDMEDATIERDQEEVVEYTLKFAETECTKDVGEESFVHGVSESCPVKNDPDKMSCRIVLTRKPNGYNHLKANCQAQM
ncbi:hypothetical protein EG68_04521 [Paragonimus skrjabini miyazakii]|uniref:Cystatin domain-containing protein n=1 Tax=Paragonimus skrjabini miyazakii TaxID=59628 RepID=A0A8S9YGG3_9TREM|nr:hypothetical protein EG68_04521 [Paragonimus skrjabini miyazakii]